MVNDTLTLLLVRCTCMIVDRKSLTAGRHTDIHRIHIITIPPIGMVSSFYGDHEQYKRKVEKGNNPESPGIAPL